MGHDIFNNIADVLALARKFDEYFGEEYPRPVDAVFCLIFSVGQTNEAAGLIAICFPGEEEPDQKEVETLLKELNFNKGGLEIRGVVPLSHFEEVLAARKAREGQTEEDVQLVPVKAMWDTSLTKLKGVSKEAVAMASHLGYYSVWDIVKCGQNRLKREMPNLAVGLCASIQIFLEAKAREICTRYGIEYLKLENLGFSQRTMSVLAEHFGVTLAHIVLLESHRRSLLLGAPSQREIDAFSQRIAAMMPNGVEPTDIMVSKTPAPETAMPTPAQ